MPRIVFVLAAALALLAPGAAFAQAAPPPGQPVRTVPARKTVVDFSDSVLHAHRDLPSEAYVLVEPPAKFEDRVPVRRDFVPELERSAERVPGP